LHKIRRIASYAAIFILFIAIGSAGLISYFGKNTPQTHQAEATLAPAADSFADNDLPEETIVQTVPEQDVVAEAIVEENVAEAPIVAEPEPAVADVVPFSETKTGYYIIVGAFSKEENADAMYAQLNTEFNGQTPLLKTKRNALTAVGFYASGNYKEALAVLSAAKEKEAHVWLLKM
jgi:hypothetical protein